MSIPSDTSPEIQAAQRQLLREMTPAQRVALATRLSNTVRNASRRAIRRVHPELTDRQVEHLFIELHYGKELADGVRAHDAKHSHG